ncbi:MAG: Hpt domain-containing protein [Halocynthiibacter sp.]
MIDWDRVAELRNEVGEEDFFEVVGLFFEESDEVADRLKLAPDRRRFEEDMHFLKGSALSLGFRALSEICQYGEKAAAAGRPELVDLPRVIAIYENSKIEFLRSSGITSAA